MSGLVLGLVSKGLGMSKPRLSVRRGAPRDGHGIEWVEDATSGLARLALSPWNGQPKLDGAVDGLPNDRPSELPVYEPADDDELALLAVAEPADDPLRGAYTPLPTF